MITVACVWVDANVPYPVEYVERLGSMVRRHLNVPHRLVCLTDRPQHVPFGFEAMHVRPHSGLPGWWSKIELFDAERLSGRCLYLDLDVLIMQSLSPIVDVDAPFALVPHAGTFKGRNGLKVVHRYNTSVMVWDDRARLSRLHRLWNPNVARRLWGDQDFVGEMLPNEHVMPIEWFPRVSEIDEDAGKLEEAKVVLCKKPKNREAVVSREWARRAWV